MRSFAISRKIEAGAQPLSGEELQQVVTAAEMAALIVAGATDRRNEITGRATGQNMPKRSVGDGTDRRMARAAGLSG
jgi:hypothetical protein